MLSRKRRRSKWTTNEVCLLVGLVLFGVLAVAFFSAHLLHGGKVAEALGGSVCLGFFGLVPGALLWRSRRKRKKIRTMTEVVRTHSGSGRGFPDVMLTSSQRLPKVCVRCGVKTGRISRLNYADGHTDASPYEWGRATPLMVFIPFFQIIAQVMVFARLWESVEKRWKRRQGQGGGVSFEIPHCKSCAEHHPILQKHFDFHGRKMIVEVHPEFRDGLAAMEQPRRR